MTVAELNTYMETHPEIDHEIDDGIAALSEVDKSLIIDSRMAWHFTKGTFKVYLSCDVETGSIRIMNANRACEHCSTLEETIANTRARRESEKKRYREQYGVDIKDLSNYSLVVDTTNATPEEVAECIISGYNAWQNDKGLTSAYISPERLNYPDTPADSEAVAELSERLDAGESIPEVTVFERDGEFYIADGLESALAYSFNMALFIPAHLVSGEPLCEYVKMKNSL